MDIQYIETMCLEFKNSIEQKIIKNKNFEISGTFDCWNYSMLEHFYSKRAICEYLLNNDNIEISKGYFNKSALCRLKIMEYFSQKNKEIQLSELSIQNYLTLFDSLIAEDQKTAVEIAINFANKEISDKIVTHPFTRNMGYALTYLILENEQELIPHLNNLDKIKSRKDCKSRSGFIDAIRAIHLKDNILLNTSLEKMISVHRRQHKNTIDEYFSITILGVMQLAILKGLEPKVDSPIAPLKYLTNNTSSI